MILVFSSTNFCQSIINRVEYQKLQTSIYGFSGFDGLNHLYTYTQQDYISDDLLDFTILHGTPEDARTLVGINDKIQNFRQQNIL